MDRIKQLETKLNEYGYSHNLLRWIQLENFFIIFLLKYLNKLLALLDIVGREVANSKVAVLDISQCKSFGNYGW